MKPSRPMNGCGLLLVLTLFLSACGPQDSDTRPVDDQRISQAVEEEPGNWLSYGMDYKEQRFSPLQQINRESVQRLDLAWYKALGGGSERMQGTPLVVDGVMYATNGWSVVFALDARTGEQLWTYDPKTNRESVKLSCCGGVVNRGVALYKGKVYVATYDGRLIAVNADDGSLVWDIDTYHESGLGPFNISGAPRAAAGKIFIGNGSSESGRRRGYVTAYDAETGELDWRFYLVPGDPSQPFEHPAMELAAKTWGGEWWKTGGGGTAWNSLVYDQEFNTLYIGVGNGAPWPRDIRSPGGTDDLFLTAVVAVDVDTGRMKWYYQTVPGDNWDYSAAMDIALADMVVDGVERKVLLQAPKNGFFYVIDRIDGELLRAHPYTEGITWATHVDMETGRPVENPEVVYEKNPAWILPANAGAHNWEPMSWDAKQGLMYFYYHDAPNFYSLDETFVQTGEYEIEDVGLSLGLGYGAYRETLVQSANERPPSEGYLLAFDPLTGTSKWKHKLPSVFNGGVLATDGGLLFQGVGNGIFKAYNTDDGEELWQYDAHGSFSSAVMTYMVEGVQYVATMVSGGSLYDRPGTLLVFRLDGTAIEPTPPLRNIDVPQQIAIADFEVTAEVLEKGNVLYHQNCAACHRGLGQASIVAAASPDLRYITTETQRLFDAIVLGGSKQALGMPAFGTDMNADSSNAIRAFISNKADELHQAQLERKTIKESTQS